MRQHTRASPYYTHCCKSSFPEEKLQSRMAHQKLQKQPQFHTSILLYEQRTSTSWSFHTASPTPVLIQHFSPQQLQTYAKLAFLRNSSVEYQVFHAGTQLSQNQKSPSSISGVQALPQQQHAISVWLVTSCIAGQHE